MNTVEEAEKLLSRMTRGEKAQLLQRVVRERGGVRRRSAADLVDELDE